MKEDDVSRDLKEKKVNATLAGYWGSACYFFGLLAVGGIIYWNINVNRSEIEFGWLVTTGLVVIAVTSFILGTMLVLKRTKKS